LFAITEVNPDVAAVIPFIALTTCPRVSLAESPMLDTFRLVSLAALPMTAADAAMPADAPFIERSADATLPAAVAMVRLNLCTAIFSAANPAMYLALFTYKFAPALYLDSITCPHLRS